MKLFPVLLFAIFVSCKGTKEVAIKKEADQTRQALNENLRQKLEAGIDIFAKGATPSSWTLEIDFDRLILFRSLDGTDYKSSPVPGIENTSNGSVVYTTKANKGNMVITLFKEECTDALSKEKFKKRVTVEVDGKRYEGCGQYLENANLNGKWILDKIGNRSVQASEFAKGLPELVLNLEGSSISGHDGCNRVNGSMEVMGNRIRFSSLASTKMACPGNNSANEFISKMSGKAASYYFKDGFLVLYLIDDSTVSFKKS